MNLEEFNTFVGDPLATMPCPICAGHEIPSDLRRANVVADNVAGVGYLDQLEMSARATFGHLDRFDDKDAAMFFGFTQAFGVVVQAATRRVCPLNLLLVAASALIREGERRHAETGGVADDACARLAA